MRRAAGRMRIRIENIIQELHRQAARFLMDSFDVILLLAFETSEMVERAQPAEPGALPFRDVPEAQGS